MTNEEKKLKRREYYLRRREYYLAQNKLWRDANKEHRAAHAAKAHQKRKQDNPALYLWKYAKARSKTDRLEFDLELEDIFIPEKCPYFGTPFVMGDKQLAASLDRIDSSKGYTKDNCEIVSWWYNCAKQTYSNDEVLFFCKLVVSTYDMNHAQNVATMAKTPEETTYPCIATEVSIAGHAVSTNLLSNTHQVNN